jgi:predicted Zn-dependent protease with MMP-like domain
MDPKRFHQLILRALQDLPAEFRRKMENVEILVEDWPPRERRRGRGGRRGGGSLLGLYHGYPLKERGPWYGNVLPDQITIYQGPIERICRNEKEMKEQVREVVLHEIGHYFGLEEEELRAIEEGQDEADLDGEEQDRKEEQD